MLGPVIGFLGASNAPLFAAAGAAVVVLVGTLWLQLEAARTDADTQRVLAATDRAQLDHTLQSAEASALAAADLHAEIQRRDRIIADYAERREMRAEETTALFRTEEAATRDAPIEYRDCVALPVPDAIAGLLRDDPGT